MYDAEHLCVARQCVAEYSEKMDVSAEQRCAIKFCVRLKKTPSKTTALFGKEMFGALTIRWWHKAFVDGRESVEFELRGDVPRTVMMVTNINTVATVIEEDQHLIVRALAEALRIPHGTESEDN